MKNAPVRAGTLTEKLTIERATSIVGDFGNKASMWEALFDIRAELIEHWQDEAPINAGSRVTVHASFCIRYVPGLRTGDRVIWCGEPFDVVKLTTLGRRQALQIDCQKVQP